MNRVLLVTLLSVSPVCRTIMSPYRLLFFILLAGTGTPAVVAQSTEQIGDWHIGQTQDSGRSRTVNMTLLPEEMGVQGVHMLTFRCAADLLAFVVTHSYMAGDNNRVQITYQLGKAEEQSVVGRLESGNQVSVYLGISPSELQALLSSPQISLLIRDTNETHRVSWNDIGGTPDAVDRLPCVM